MEQPTTTPFAVKAYPEMWAGLDVDVPRFDKARQVLGMAYEKMYLSQPNRPQAIAYFDDLMAEIFGRRIEELLAVKKEGRPVVGTFCPYFQAVDFVYGETTCDAKKKTWEFLDRLVPTYVMEIPQMKKARDKTLWLEEVGDFKAKVEEVCGTTVTADNLAKAIVVINDKRRALQRLTKVRGANPAPISGKDALLVEQMAFYDEPVRFARQLNELCDELEERVRSTTGVTPASAPRIMVSGTPMALPSWKVHNLVETAGAVIVNEESCIGTRYFKDLIDESRSNLDQQLEALTDRYMQIDCSCFTPNNERVDQVLKEYRASKAQGILHYSLQFCHTYNIEEIKIREACEQEGISYLAIETDYSPEDVGQLQTRIEAFMEQIRG